MKSFSQYLLLICSSSLAVSSPIASKRLFRPPSDSANEHVFSSFSNFGPDGGFKIPTVHESAIQARRILNLESIGTLSTVFPPDRAPSELENRPIGLGGAPIGLMDYFANCEPDSGNPTILAIGIATSFKNVDSGSNISLSLRWHPPNTRVYSAAAIPRFSIIGHLEEIPNDVVQREDIAKCFTKYHPDARAWLPGNRIHESKWVRLVVEEVYWIGGFGDRAYIGWIAERDWKSVTAKEVEKCRLPGETNSGFNMFW